MAKAYVSDNRMPYLARVFERDGIKYQSEKSNGGGYLVHVPISNSRLKEAISDDCLCMMESEKYGGFPVYSLKTVSNPGKLSRLVKINHTNAFFILSRDEEAYLKM